MISKNDNSSFRSNFAVVVAILAIISIFFTMCYSATPQHHISEKLKAIPSQDRSDIESLFLSLFLRQGFVYTLFDERAMAYTAYFQRIPLVNIQSGRLDKPVAPYWKAWEKYKHLFPMEQFALITTEDPAHASQRIYLINKKLYFRAIDEARPDASWVINSGKTIPELKKLFREFKIEGLPNYVEILGVLLGFGESNSYLFYRRDILENIVTGKHPEYGKAILHGTLPVLQQELEEIQRTLKCVRTHSGFKGVEYIASIGFLADTNTEETKKICKRLIEARDAISEIYSRGDFLEITLERLTAIHH